MSGRAMLVVCVAGAALTAGLAHHSAAAPPAPARPQVVAREHAYALSRGAVRAGPVVVELANLGEDDHDLALRRLGPGAVTRRIGRTAPGTVRELEATLRAGRYRLWCTLADHRARGMVATLAVRARSTSGRSSAAARPPAGAAGR